MDSIIVIVHYVVYLLISASLTVWVGRTLLKNSRIFLVEAFNGNESMADSVNHLLIVGFYLVSFGILSLFLRYGDKPLTIVDSIELMSTKIGVVLLILGVVHISNIFVFKVFDIASIIGSKHPKKQNLNVPAAVPPRS